ncbi:ATP-dependent DNA helicase DinG [Natronocella acetinitrilica]|uniref:ATP-dependent DNA helicase DinG n=1 Tax=Natronocella acetinitrilica TaxID=414046 RepID=A0AAE3G4C8_9GAMM|nr:ATP-dependent DNA helicase [Natronocella acetinitrilica]MCP1674948.1 ATP-dependent DNA helicase DinG [Natronocella acetinitrilica]
MSEIERYFEPEGALAQSIDGFQTREEQLALAQAVEAAIAKGGTLVAEAGTGTGKTFAYLLPALCSGRRVVISTGTRTLQDQLYQKDLPLVRQALDLPVRTALLKGRSNYLCLYRLDRAELDGRLESREAAADLQAIRQWASRTRTGDIAELSDVPAEQPIWIRATSTVDNCLGQECPQFGECFLMEARRRAQEAELVVVNHHLLMADMALKEGGFGEVLPAADAYVLDEAHQLPDIAAQFFGLNFSSRQIMDLLRDVTADYLSEAGDVPEMTPAIETVRRATQDLRLALGHGKRREAWTEVEDDPQVADGLDALEAALSELQSLLEPLAARGKGLESSHRRAQELGALLGRFRANEEEGSVRWFETHAQSFLLRLTPLDVGAPFHRHMERHPAAWIFTSATLSVNRSFDHFRRRLGLDEADELQLDSPFDYGNNALLYAPKGLPAPNMPAYDQAFLREALVVLRASRGRAFVLFTSHRALRHAAEWLRERLDYPLLVQGEAAQHVLLESFRQQGNAVLLGTASFWEGVDVKGSALSAVLIDRLPFASPGDPVTRARIDHLRRNGGNPFVDFQLPNAVITLRQGVGRLIRDERDTGVLMIGDPRLTTKSYGRQFLNSLPAMARTREISIVRAFLESEETVE